MMLVGASVSVYNGSFKGNTFFNSNFYLSLLYRLRTYNKCLLIKYTINYRQLIILIMSETFSARIDANNYLYR